MNFYSILSSVVKFCGNRGNGCFSTLWLFGSLVRGRSIVFRHYYKSIAECVGKDFRDGAVVLLE